MRSLIIVFLIAIGTAGCGSDVASTTAGSSGACAGGPFVGTWSGTVAGYLDVMTLNADCTGSSTYCVSTFTYPSSTTGSSGNVAITVTASSAKSECMPVGQTTCGYSVSGNTLSFSCLGGTLTYSRN